MQDNAPKNPASTPIKVAAVVLAAGRSTRMGPVNKLTADFHGAALVRHAAEAAVGSRAADVVVVTGHDAPAVKQALGGLDLRFVENPDFADGLASSVKAGIAAVPADCAGAVILLGDMPGVTAPLVDALIDAFKETGGGNICQPRYDGRPGNPVLWPRRLFAEFAGLSGDVGAKPLINKRRTEVLGVDVGTGAIHMDIDAPEDLSS
jgi:molybdenum cofactor cytidylyltransferase